jgi:hypothetical protein
MMRAKKEDIPIAFEDGKSYMRSMEWGDMDVGWTGGQAGRDSTQQFKGLPDDRCPVPHWGYLIKGRMRIKYRDHDEVINAGEVFYMQPGHIPIVEEDCELVDFSPKGENKKVIELVSRNREAMKKKG